MSWSCAACTSMNSDQTSVCEVCDTPCAERGGEARWQCEQCTSLNSGSVCCVCGHPHASAAAAPGSGGAAAEPRAAPPGGEAAWLADVLRQPLLGELQPLSVLAEEYHDNPDFLAKLPALQQRYTALRRCR